MAAWSTRYCSAGVCGWYWAWSPARIWSKSSRFSPGRTTVRARRPWCSAFMEAVALPGRVFGPVDLRALRRFAAVCLFVDIELPFLNERSQFWGGVGELRSPTSTKGVDVTRAMGRGGDTAIRVRGSEFKLAPRRFGTGCRGAGEGPQVIEKSGRRGRGEYLAVGGRVWRGRAGPHRRKASVLRGGEGATRRSLFGTACVVL